MKTSLSLVLGALALTWVNAATAETLRASTWLPSNDVHTIHAFNEWAETVAEKTGGELAFEVLPGAALMPAKSHLQGVGDGLAHVGFHYSGYTPADLPIANSLSGMGFMRPDPLVLAYAFADFVMNDPAARAEFERYGVLPVGGFSTPLPHFLCKGVRISMPDDLRGKRVRFPGGPAANLASSLGVTTVNITGPEIYQAFSQNQLDCAAIDATYLTGSQNLVEVTDSVTLVDFTPGFISPLHVYNAATWQGFSEDQRRTLLDATAEAMAALQIAFEADANAALEDARAAGHDIVEPDASLTDAIQAWVDAGVGDMAGQARTTYGIEDPEALFATFQTYIDKWSALVEALPDRNDAAALVALGKDNLFDRVDVATYGME